MEIFLIHSQEQKKHKKQIKFLRQGVPSSEGFVLLE